MSRGVVWAAGAVAGILLVLLLSGCGGTNTEGQTLQGARQTLDEAGVPEENVTVAGPEASGDPARLSVCAQTPSSPDSGDTVTLEVATTCPQAAQDDDDDGDDRRRRSGGRRR